MQGVSLRLARPADAAAMTVMQRASWLAAYGEVLGADMLAQLAVTDHLQIWRHRLAEPGPVPMLVCQDDVVIGLLYWQPSLEEGLMTARIRALYLHPDFWRQGIGTMLIKHAARTLKEQKHGAICLWVLDGNARAKSFYEKMGGQKIGNKMIEIGPSKLKEVCYGWRDTAALRP